MSPPISIHRWHVGIVLGASLLVGSGCSSGLPPLRLPEHLYTQRLRATYHDPYANPYVAPEIEGARPEQYELPRPVPVQSQWFN